MSILPVSGSTRFLCLLLASTSFLICQNLAANPAEESIPADLMQALQKARHQIEPGDNGQFKASNPGNRQHILFADKQFEISPAGVNLEWTWGLRLTGYGSPDQINPVGEAAIKSDGQRIEYQRSDIIEWYQNLPLGLEQGFTLTEPPAANIDQLVIEMAIEGDLEPRWLKEGQSLAFHDRDGNYALTYKKLVAFDANQRELPAEMQLSSNSLLLHVDASKAVWPITVDPLVVNEQKVTAKVTDGAAGDQFGVSVSISGETALIGALADDDNGANSGSAYIFVRSGTDWTQKAKLLASDGAASDWFGISVALDDDTAVIGAPQDDDAGFQSGSAYVFVKPAGGWATTSAYTAKLTASDGTVGDSFGYSVALADDIALIGAKADDDHGSTSGSAYVFVKPGGDWVTTSAFTAKLTASDGAAFDEFGFSVALSGDTALVGAVFDDDYGADSGSVYVFAKPGGGWVTTSVFTAKLTASDGAAFDRFGLSVALSGDTVLVGAYQDDDHGEASGSAYVFVKPGGGWVTTSVFTAKLTASDGAAFDRFGYSVSLSGGTALVGAIYDDDLGNSSGSVYIFVKPGGGWVTTSAFTTKFTASDGMAEDLFGYAISLSGDTALVGARFDDDSGSAYVFNVNNYGQWGQQTKLLPVKNDGAVGDFFGSSVALSGDTALIGARLDDDNGSQSGSAYMFTRFGGSWKHVAKLTASDGAANDFFGSSVALSGDTALVGAYEDDDHGSASGAAYVFTKPGGGWATTSAFTAKLTASDGAASDFFGSSVALSGDTVLVGAWRDDDNGSSSGSAYVFVKPGGGWATTSAFTAKLTASDGVAGDEFGYSVALSGNTALVGAFADDDLSSNTGSAYVFVEPGGGWATTSAFTAKLTASDFGSNDLFGYSVALSGDTALVGGP